MAKIFRYKKFLQEFPFLGEIEKLDENFNFSVKKVDEKFLQSKVEEYFHDGSLGETSIEETLYVVNDDGIQDSGITPEYHSGSNYAHSTLVEYAGTPIWEHIHFNYEVEKIKFLVLIRTHYSSWSGSNEINEKFCTIYKCADIDDMIKSIIDKENQKLDAELSD